MTSLINYCGLHRHGSYSFLDGFGRGRQVAERLKELGQTACGITEHGNLSGHAEFDLEFRKLDIKPIFGIEFYHVQAMRVSTDGLVNKRKTAREAYEIAHLTILARDQTGYSNLLKLSSESYERGFYRKPSIDNPTLLRYQKGLIVLSGCVAGKISRLINEDRLEDAREWLRFYQQNIEHFYVEIVPCPGLKISHVACKHLWQMAKELQIPIVVTDDAHFPRPEDSEAQDTLLCANLRMTAANAERDLRIPEYHYHCDGPEVLRRCQLVLPEVPTTELIEAIERSVEIANGCSAELPRSTGPIFQVPEGLTDLDLLKRWVDEGKAYRRQLGLLLPEDSPEWQTYLQREAYELDIVKHHNFVNYFLIVADMVRWSNQQGYWCTARGSCGGSLLCFYLSITQLDPIRWDLPVERFIDYTRSDLPDIDLDFDGEYRDQVFAYLEEKYQTEHCAHIAALSSFRARQALNDVGFVHEMPVNIHAAMTALVPEGEEADEGLHDEEVLQRLFEHHSTAQKLLERWPKLILAAQLEGQFRTSSIHAAGFIIDSKPLTETVGIVVQPGKQRCVSVNKDYAAAQGLLKIDCLSSSTMTGIVRCLKAIGRDIDWLYRLSFDDPMTYEILAEGLNQGIFQLQGNAAGRVLSALKPGNIDELAVISALARPGPLQSGSVETYIDRKYGREPIPPMHPIAQKVLGKTYGVVIYQEQVMAIAREIGGMDQAKVNKIRKLISKSGGAKAVEPYEAEYLAGAAERGVSEEEARAIWEQCVAAGNYIFNAAHAYAYALIGYWTAYLKAHYPAEFCAAMARSFKGQQAEDKTRRLFRDFQIMGGKFELLDYNRSQESFSVYGETILGGFGNLKACGPQTVRDLRRNGPYGSWDEFYVASAMPRHLRQALMATGVHAGALSTDDVMAIAPWYPLVVFTPEEEVMFQKNDCLPIAYVRAAMNRPNIGNVPILGRVTAGRFIDLVAQAKKYGSEPPLPGDPTIRAVITLTDPTGSIDVPFSAKKWQALARAQLMEGPGKGYGNTLFVWLTFSEDRSRIYGETAQRVRVWRPQHQPGALAEQRKVTKASRISQRDLEEFGKQMRLNLFEESRLTR